MKIPAFPNSPLELPDNIGDLVASIKVTYTDFGDLTPTEFIPEVLQVTDGYVNVLGKHRDPVGEEYRVFYIDRDTRRLSTTGFTQPWTLFNIMCTIFSAGVYAALASPWLVRRAKKRELYCAMVKAVRQANTDEAVEKIGPIKVYQGSQGEVQQELGRQLERVDIGRPETFIKASDLFSLRIAAYRHGADAVVRYQPGSAIGTPVRFADRD
ncbi:hypothetical protein ACFL0V_04450 [Nanoarchaeota archaeon]